MLGYNSPLRSPSQSPQEPGYNCVFVIQNYEERHLSIGVVAQILGTKGRLAFRVLVDGVRVGSGRLGPIEDGGVRAQ